MNQPVISVITVVLNAKRDFEQTAESVRAQTYPHLEWVVVDGVSNDGTLEAIDANSDIIGQFVSERDKGFYDAMNKGLRLATGEYVVYINAGDELYAPETLEKVVAEHGAEPDVYYGDTVLTDASQDYAVIGPRDHKLLPPSLTYRNFRYGSVVCHQSFIARRSLCPEYDLNYPGSADIDWSIKVLKRAKRIHNTGLIISKYLVGGLSHKHRWRYMKERFWIGVQHYGFLRTVWDNTVMVAAHLVGKKL